MCKVTVKLQQNRFSTGIEKKDSTNPFLFNFKSQF
ncbi:hypothetical protein SAMN04488122_1318 [Chitinophaga arvensicola]|uniref:Uncharacterized protein n=1 Tax=Chitinophaga arvensicola TaxID=29529 RepID=A0A1I0Q9W5_9BACT|nr:hypothetical protein SAMN04488122_1318 [Chitinophaga arvensicola]